MNFIVGLGNPGKKYEQTRHNVGFMLLDALADKLGQAQDFQNNKKLKSEVANIVVRGEKTLLIKPQTFMNESGQAVRAVIDYYGGLESGKGVGEGIQNLWVIHDDLDVELGKYKIQFGKGPKVHNGLNNIYQHLGTNQFWHVRVGVDGRNGNRSMPANNYVLSQFLAKEKVLVQTVIEEIVTELID